WPRWPPMPRPSTSSYASAGWTSCRRSRPSTAISRTSSDRTPRGGRPPVVHPRARRSRTCSDGTRSTRRRRGRGSARGVLRGRRLGERRDDVGPALLVALERDDLLFGRLLEQLRERRVAIVRLVEGGILAD